MDAPAGWDHAACLGRACTASAVWGAGAGADQERFGSRWSVRCGDDPKARPGILALEVSAPGGDRLQPVPALDRGAAVREPERRQGAGVLLRRAHRRAVE